MADGRSRGLERQSTFIFKTGVPVLTFLRLALTFYPLKQVTKWVLVIVLYGMAPIQTRAGLRERPWLRRMWPAQLRCISRVERV